MIATCVCGVEIHQEDWGENGGLRWVDKFRSTRCIEEGGWIGYHVPRMGTERKDGE